MKFSERYGYTKPRDIFQLEEMDDALRTDLWNLFYKWYYNWNRRGAGGEYIWREVFQRTY